MGMTGSTAQAGLSPEDRLLLLSAGARAGEDETARVDALVSGVRNWDLLVENAVRHGTASLLHALLDRIGASSAVPDGARERLRKIFYATALRNARVEGQLTQILSTFRERSIDAMLLKGLFVLHTLYEESGLRPIGDIDLLVHSSDVARADSALRRLGYSLRAGSMPLGFYRQVHFHVLYHGTEGGSQCPVEVHWDVQDMFNVLRIDIAQIWNRAVRWNLEDETVWVMGREDLLAYLCYHADKHACFGRYVDDFSEFGIKAVLDNCRSAQLIWYADIVRLLDVWDSGLDWDLFLRSCADWGIGREVRSTLSIVGKMVESPAVGSVTARIEPARAAPGIGRLYRMVVAGGPDGLSDHRLVGRIKSVLLGSGSWLQFRPVRFLDVLTYVFPARREIAKRYGVRWGVDWLAYLWHIPKSIGQIMLHAATLIGYSAAKHLRSESGSGLAF